MKNNTEEKVCFILSPIGPRNSDVRSRSDVLLKYLFRPALEQCGYTGIRADEIAASGMITTQVIRLIRDAPLVIADLTGGNPNVFYELAVRHFVGKPYIQVIQEGDRIPFDIQGTRTISVDHKDMVRNDEALASIVKTIRSFEGGHVPDSPISTAISATEIQESTEAAESVVTKVEHIRETLRIAMPNLDYIARKLGTLEREILQSAQKGYNDLL